MQRPAEQTQILPLRQFFSQLLLGAVFLRFCPVVLFTGNELCVCVFNATALAAKTLILTTDQFEMCHCLDAAAAAVDGNTP